MGYVDGVVEVENDLAVELNCAPPECAFVTKVKARLQMLGSFVLFPSRSPDSQS
jgi:hypothetical protein